jgi:hypothetical protein
MADSEGSAAMEVEIPVVVSGATFGVEFCRGMAASEDSAATGEEIPVGLSEAAVEFVAVFDFSCGEFVGLQLIRTRASAVKMITSSVPQF